MSRTIRNKGRYLNHIKQLNNPFRYIKLHWYNDIDEQIERNINRCTEVEELKKTRTCDGFHVTHRWIRFIDKNPRLHHKAAIAYSLKYDTDYAYDENARRKYRRGVAINWD